MTSAVLDQFIQACHRHYSCFAIAKLGLVSFAEKMKPHILDDDKQRLFFGNSDPNEGKPAQAAILLNDAVKASDKNGKFHDQLAKLILVNIYTEWDELYRPEMAKELKTSTKLIKSDLMGDLRLIRNCIIHNKSRISKDLEKLKVLKIYSHEELLVIPEEDLCVIMDQINRMTVEVLPHT